MCASTSRIGLRGCWRYPFVTLNHETLTPKPETPGMLEVPDARDLKPRNLKPYPNPEAPNPKP